MTTLLRSVSCFFALLIVLGPSPVRGQNSGLEAALGDLYGICLFENVANNPFSQAATLARQALAPGISNFLESSLAAIPLTPPSLDVEYADGEIVTVVTGFTPIYTESVGTVGGGRFLVGSSFSYFSLSRLRGTDLDDLEFAFAQDGGGDLVTVTMPFDLDASVFTLYGTYGITDRLDIGAALPIVRLSLKNVETTFSVVGDRTGCRYSPSGLNCNGVGVRSVSPPLEQFGEVAGTEIFLNTFAVRAKYRFPTSWTTGRLAALVDMRFPVGRGDDFVLGAGHFGTRVTLVGEYDQGTSFTPYLNLGAQFWNGQNPNSVRLAAGFTQQLLPELFFAFDLLGAFDIEDAGFLDALDDARPEDTTAPAYALAASSIPAMERDHLLNAGLGLQYALSPSVNLYGTALFALLDSGLQSNIAPTVGASFYY